jgi:polysaccharide export outer membrane protein
MHSSRIFSGAMTLVFLAASLAGAAGQQPPNAAIAPPPSNGAAGAVTPALPASYVIGTDDVLAVVFWHDKDMSVDAVTVRPDGKISLPLLNDVHAAGYTPDQLRAVLVQAASKYVEEPNATVLVKEIHSRKVFITGNVSKPGIYPLSGEMNVLQLIAQAGGLLEYADAEKIVVMRSDNGPAKYLTFNYKDVLKRKNIQQNVLLKPGDTIVVP